MLCQALWLTTRWAALRKVRAAVQILHKQRILLRQELNDLGSHTDEGVHVGETLTSPQLMSLETEGSSTMNLSLGERPVRSPVSVLSAP